MREGDPVDYSREFGALYASATYYDLNVQRLRLLESVMLGQNRIKDWEFDSNQRFSDTEESNLGLTYVIRLDFLKIIVMCLGHC